MSAHLQSRLPDPASPPPVTLVAGDGLPLSLQQYGRTGHPPLLFAHGFGQTRLAWRGSAMRLAEAGFHCLAADARGHGDSGWCGEGEYDIDHFVGDMVQAARFAGPGCVLVGASFGGLIGLLSEADHAPLFRALVLVDITPRWEAAGVERILTFMRAHPEGFASLREASQAIATYLPHRADSRSPERLRSLLVQQENGRFRWHWDPKLLERIADDSEKHQARLLQAAARIRVPTLLLSGSDSDVVSQSTIAEFRALVPHAEHVVVPRATHMVVGDRNEAFTDAVLSFVRSLGRGRD
ncbi:alpha/beta fold hydrolase [Tahibacter amnicola]|uniref:Alpha/beta hydrolase n=1 Tax=Tahibacter amnicola TaxID=2976241 RepID=A0ABY6BID7_9GAMM|nr:alpha/beta hydrolase [Tahibacter amnicola]UXI67632.1 alpha/beta hydrolase [Tahibacter amnicola]